VILAAFIAGGAIGWASRTAGSREPEPVPTGPNRNSEHFRIPRHFPGAAASPQAARPPRFQPKVIAAGRQDALTPRREALRLLFDVVSEESLQRALVMIIWGHPEMERKALALFRALRDPADLDLFVKLDLLGAISNPEVQAEIATWIRSESDPTQRSRLARIVGYILQNRGFMPEIEFLLADPDPRVVCAVLEAFRLSRSEVRDDPALKLRLADRLKSAAAPDRPVYLRVKAVAALRGADDEPTARFLMDLAVRERQEEVACAALGSMPDGYEIHRVRPALAVEMIRLLYSIAVDESRPASVRWAAACAADNNDMVGEDKVLTASEQELVQEILSTLRQE